MVREQGYPTKRTHVRGDDIEEVLCHGHERAGIPYKDDTGPKEMILKMSFAMDILTKNRIMSVYGK